MDINIELQGTPTKRWGYEQAFSSGHILAAERSRATDTLEQYLNAQFGMEPDNKVTFEMVSGVTTYYVTFHDSTIYIGTSVRPYRGDTLAEPKTKSH